MSGELLAFIVICWVVSFGIAVRVGTARLRSRTKRNWPVRGDG